MKKDIHPQYMECEVHCACGSTIRTKATVPIMKLDICSVCHPFFTGKQKLVDTAGRIEKFQRRYAKKDKDAKAVAS